VQSNLIRRFQGISSIVNITAFYRKPEHDLMGEPFRKTALIFPIRTRSIPASSPMSEAGSPYARMTAACCGSILCWITCGQCWILPASTSGETSQIAS
jgi:hypothetical protein